MDNSSGIIFIDFKFIYWVVCDCGLWIEVFDRLSYAFLISLINFTLETDDNN